MAIHSVSEVNRYVKGLLGHDRALSSIMVRGEISNFKRYASGHCYFSLKDAAGKLKAVMFRGNASHLRFQPEDGLTVVASGSIEVYERDGVYQLIVRSMAPEGIGDLALAYEQLKAKLAAEGLFDAARKNWEQWEYTGMFFDSARDIVIIDFRDGLVVSMNSFSEQKQVLPEIPNNE